MSFTKKSDGSLPTVPIIGTGVGLGLAALAGLILFGRKRRRRGSRGKHSR